ncbi:MAG: GntR family transcriptional regulator [Chloroflexota bacterium]
MELQVNKKSGTPIYLQLKRQIDHLVKMGIWPAGMQLPTERELAEILGVSRNTVSAAYKELEAEGVLVSQQGRGTFVTASETATAMGKQERLAQMIDAVINESLDLGVELDTLAALSRQRIEERRELLGRVKVAFIECNREQLDYFAKELELGSGVTMMPVLLSDFEQDSERLLAELVNMDLVVTTFFHLDEVRELVGGRVEVLGIALDPQLGTIVRIARMPKGIRVGLVCISEPFAERVVKSMANAGIEGLNVTHTTSKDESELRRFLAKVDACIVSPGRRAEVERLVPPGTDVIEFIYVPDAGSVNRLKSVLTELRTKK